MADKPSPPPKKTAAKPASPKPAAPKVPSGAKPASRPAKPAGRANAAPSKPVPPRAAQAAAAPAGQQAMAAKANDPESHADDGDEEEPIEGQGGSFFAFTAVPSWAVSMLVHIVVLLVLALLTLEDEIKDQLNTLVVGKEDAVEELDDFEEEEELDPVDVEAVTSEVQESAETVEVPVEIANLSPTMEMEAAPVAVELSDFGETTAPKNDLMATVGAYTGTGIQGRGAAAREAAIRAGGGSKGSETAVAAALKWLAEHQMPDGSWNFDHRQGLCQGRCPDHGSQKAMTNAATAMGVLPFLGAGHTHVEGKYKKNVYAALFHLAKKMKVSQKGGDLTDGGHGMYSHGLAAIALCEAYGMTQDNNLLAPAQAAAYFCATAQDQVTGGWGYGHGSGNDTSVAGWQIMALKSAHMGYLQIPPNSIKRAYKFLDSVQSESGAKYGYRGPGGGKAMTAVGLLCRMYMGWKQDHPALRRGVIHLSKWGPASNNMYYNYYANQVMFQNTSGKGPVWEKWNTKLRDQLINTQAKQGHMTGSWKNCSHAGSGGRVYSTSLSCMALEIYYRHMPIYRQEATEDDFEL